MRTYRAARLVAILLFVVAAVYFGGGLFVGLSLWTRGLGEGWGSGFAGWISIPILLGAFFGAAVLLLFGAILYFLARIGSNLSDARERMKALKERPAPAAAVTPAAAELRVPPAQASVPAEPIIVAPAAIPAVVLAVAAELPKVEVAAPTVELPKVEAELPAIEAAAPKVELPVVDIAAPEIELPEVAAELPEIDAESEPKEFGGKLPGLEEAARIASEIAASEEAGQPTD